MLLLLLYDRIFIGGGEAVALVRSVDRRFSVFPPLLEMISLQTLQHAVVICLCEAKQRFGQFLPLRQDAFMSQVSCSVDA